MIRYLLRDALRRHMPIYLTFGGFLALIWLLTVSGALAPSGALAFSLGHAWFLGVFAGVSLFTAREVGLLPIPRRTLWRAQWLASTVVATCWTTAAKLVGALVGALFAQPLDLGFIALSGCLDFLYNGALLAVAVATGVAAGRIRENGSILRKAIQTSGMFVALMGGFAWGFMLRIVVPTNWTQVTGVTAMVMGAALAVSLAAFFHSPRAGTRWPGKVRPDVRRQDGVRSGSRRRLVGLHKLVADDLKSTAVLAAALPVIIGAAFYGVILFNPSPGDASPLKVMQEMGWLPLRPDTLFRHCFFLVFVGLSMINNRMSTRGDPVSPLLRQLRVLPISVRQLNALLVCRRLLGWLVVWLFLLAFHVVVFRGAPSTLRLDILVWVAGSDALVYTLQLRWMKWLPTFAFAMCFSLFCASVIDATGALAPYAGVAIGLMCLMGAVELNYSTLTRRKELYRGMAPPPFAKPFAMR